MYWGVSHDYGSCLCQDALDALVDMREYDVPYHMRFQIDTDVRCGHWFTVTAKVKHPPGLDLLRRTDLMRGHKNCMLLIVVPSSPEPDTKPAVRLCLALLQSGNVSLERREDLLQRAEPRICAFDIETTKLPLQFPNAEHDQVCCPLLTFPHATLPAEGRRVQGPGQSFTELTLHICFTTCEHL